ncbi:MAG: hypothetical protein V3U31_03940 [Dehalococcoidia bacterium]
MSANLQAQSSAHPVNEELECWLSEFKALREEILSRRQDSMTSILTNVTILGSILAAAFYLRQEPPVILLAIPFVSSSLGLYYLNQRLTISDIGLYIRDRISPAVCRLTQNAGVFQWEVTTRGKLLSARELTIATVIPLIFSLPSLASLMATIEIGFSTEPAYMAVAWWLDAVLALAFLALWIALFRRWWGSQGREKDLGG